jgi:uncharacterized protein
MGKTGVGKSTTINSLFEQNLETDNAIACTKSENIVVLNNTFAPNLPYNQLQIVDLPGIGESIETDEEYQSIYKKWASKSNTLVWVTQADTRAYKRDQIYLSKLIMFVKPSLKFIIALNKMDLLVNELSQVNYLLNEISKTKKEDIFTIFKDIIKDKLIFTIDQIIPYSAIYKLGLDNLKIKMLEITKDDK